MLYEVLFLLYNLYLGYMCYYIFMIYLHVYYMFFNFVTFLYYLILNLCDNVFIFIMCTKVLGQVPARKITPPPLG